MSSSQGTDWTWLLSGDEVFPAMLAAIDAAQRSVSLETYIFSPAPIGQRFRQALVKAQQRGARVRVLVDAIGSVALADDFWAPLRAAGGEARFFNPIALRRFGIRNHRKLLVCDDAVAFVGGFNITPECEGDGIARGWCDLGLRLEGRTAAELAASFEQMFRLADFRHKRFARLRRAPFKRTVNLPAEQLLLGGPGRGVNPIRRALQADLRKAQRARIMVGYFLPTGRVRRGLLRLARRGAKVQLLLAGKSDVVISRLAGRSLYRRFFSAGAEIYEYQPQILHAKLFILDDIVYVGSANLDPRSLSINYDLMIRIQNPILAARARGIFDETLKHSVAVTPEGWRLTTTFWSRLKERWAYFLLARIDPYLARRQWRRLPD